MHALSSSSYRRPMDQTQSDRAASAALAELQQQMLKAVRRACPQWLESDVEDLAQEAMIKLTRMQAADQDSRQWTMAYLKRTAHSVIVDEIRKRQRRPDMGTEAGGETERVEDPKASPDATDTQAAIEDCLSEQIDARRRAVTLHLLGHTVGEIAGYLECKAKKAENLVYRGIKQLRDCLALKGVHP